MKKKISFKNILNCILVLFLILLFCYLCFSENGLIDLIKNSKGFNKSWIFAAFLCQIINLVIDTYLVYRFTYNMDKRYKFKNAIRVAMVGQFFSAVTPGASGGQPMQVYAMKQYGIDTGLATAALTQKFLVYQTVLTSYSLIAILLRFEYFNSLNGIVWTIALTGFIMQALVITAIILFSFSKKLTHKIIVVIFVLLEKMHIIKNANEKIELIDAQLIIFHNSNKYLYKNKYTVLETYVCTAVLLTAIFLIPYCIYRAFNLSGQKVSDMICAQAFVSMSSGFIPIPGSSGAAEGASSIFFQPFFDETTIKSAIALSRFITYYFTIIVSAPFAKFTKKKDKQV